MATRARPTAHARLAAFVDDVLDEASLPIHLKREARGDFLAHLDADVAMALRNGMSEDEAIESAIHSFGAISELQHALRHAAAASEPHGRRRLALLGEEIGRDLRGAVRSLWMRRATSAIAIATLALGIGITAAAYAVFDWVLVRPLPYRAAHELARVFAAGKNPLTAPNDPSYTEFEAIAGATGVRGAFSYSSATRVLAAAGVEPTHVTVARVAGDLFATLGVGTREGRGLTRDEIQSGAPSVVLSERFWRAKFNAANVVNQTVTIDGVLYTIVGVTSAGRAYPRDADLWRPLTPAEREDDDQEMVTIVRISAPGNRTALNAEIGAVAGGASGGKRTAWLEDMQRTDVREVRGALTMLVALSGLILLIACTNVAALLGGRNIDRVGELAVRGAMGASRLRLLQQLMVEHLLLALAGGAAGVVVGQWTLDTLRVLAPVAIPRLDEVTIDARIFLAGAFASLAIGLIVGLAVAWRATAQSLHATMQTGGSVRATPPRLPSQALTALQAAMAVVLIVAAALLGRALQNLVQINHGFDPDNLIAVHLYMRGPSGPDPRKVFPQVVDAAREVRGVAAAAVALRLPTQIGGIRSAVVVPGQPETRVIVRPITSAYFDVSRIPLLQGRAFTSADGRGTERVMIVNQAFTREMLNGAPAIGLRVKSDLVAEPLTIVGVVGDVTPAGEVDRPAMYIAIDQLSVAGGALLVRTTMPPSDVLPALRARLRAVAPTFPLDRVTVITEVLAEGRATTRFLTQLAAAFGFFALVLAALGVYGLTCREIAARWRELAVRQALGARRTQLVRQSLRPAIVPVVSGGVIGAVASVEAGAWMATLVEGLARADAVTLAGVPILLMTIAVTAALVATQRVLTADPARTLRE